jgi:hypothetical protein
MAPNLAVNLSALFPRLAEGLAHHRRVDREAEPEPESGLLILSAAYPQPGWGVWIRSLSGENFTSLEHTFELAVQTVTTPEYIKPIREATRIYEERKRIRRDVEGALQSDSERLGETLRTVELEYRQSLAMAMEVQSRLGPALLFELERLFKQDGLIVRSLAWDGARMVGWKLKAAVPEITNEDFIAAVNSVLGPMALHPGPAADDATGSSFADYAYYVAMTAEKLTPWKATRELVSRLLSIPQIRRLLGPENADVPGAGLPELAGRLIEAWGWEHRGGNITTPLRACLSYGPGGTVTLEPSVQEVRISLESFLKDLVRLSFRQLGWHGGAIDRELATHCPRFRRNRPGAPWAVEMQYLSAGPSLILLDGILPLAFPRMTDAIDFPAWIQRGHDLLHAFNPYCHENPPPPPDVATRLEWGANLERLISELETVVTELPWHLKVVQIFDQDPCVVSGHAWSHSHPEERFLRVLLPDHDARREEMILWNPSLGNPIMTDPVVMPF